MSRTVTLAFATMGFVATIIAVFIATTARAQQFTYDTVVGAVEVQGMEAQRIVGDVVLIALGMEEAVDVDSMSLARQQFDGTLSQFRDDSTEFGARTAGHPEIAERVLEAEDLWRAMDQAVDVCVTAETASECDVATVAGLSEDLQTVIDKLVEDLRIAEGQGSYGMLTNAVLTVEQTQVLSQQMTKDFLLVAYGHQPDRYRSSLRGTSQAFEQKLLGLLEGDFDQLLLPPPTPEIRAQLGRVQQVWRDEYRPLIDRAVDREDLDSLTIARISRASRNLFREIGSASQLYRGL